MKTPADYDNAITAAMKHMPAGAALNLTINALRAGRDKAEARMAKQELKALSNIKASIAARLGITP